MQPVEASNPNHTETYGRVILQMEKEKKELQRQLEDARNMAAHDFNRSEKLLQENNELRVQLQEQTWTTDSLKRELEKKEANYQNLAEMYALKEQEDQRYKLTMGDIIWDKNQEIEKLTKILRNADSLTVTADSLYLN